MILIPIGHDQQTVRRLPWITFALIAANVLAFIGLAAPEGDVQSKLADAANEAIGYWMEHPHVDEPTRLLDALVEARQISRRGREDLTIAIEARKSLTDKPDGDVQRVGEQRQMEALVARYFALRDDNAVASWGLVPARFSWPDLFKSMFMHAGWMHLLGNMLFLFLAGPPIEDAFGRPLFGALYGASGIVAALAFVARYPDSTVPLVGASGAIAGLMGAFLIRCSRTKIRFFWTFFLRGGTFDAPAWFVLPLWLLQQLFYQSMVGEKGGVAFLAHIGGFVFGAGAAFVIKASRFEERYIHPGIEKKIGVTQHPALEEGMALLVRGEDVAAREALARVLADEPRNADAHLAIWESFVHEGRPAEGADNLVKVIEDELRRGERALALEHWRELVGRAGVGGPGPLRLRLASELGGEDAAAAREILEQLAGDASAGLLQEKARARLGLEPTTAPPVAAPPPPRRESPPPPQPAPIVAPPLPDLGWEPEAEVGPEQEPAPPQTPVIESCTIEGLDEAAMLVRGEDGLAEPLLYSQLAAVAFGGVAGEGGRPYLVLDLVLTPFGSAPRHIYRAVSTRLDPAEVLQKPGLAPMEGFRTLVRHIAREAGVPILPSEDALTRPRVFPDVEEYGRVVLGAFLEPVSA